YYNIVLSMKASNPQVMIQAYRLLVQKLDEEGLQPYPLHLGVTEAGDGEDGRVKSAVGIGTLLEDGLGDTIRVSLTEEPEAEVPVAIKLANRYIKRKADPIDHIKVYPIDPFAYNKRSSREVMDFGGNNVPRVLADFSNKEKITPASLFALGYQYSVPLDKWHISDMACDYIYVGKNQVDFEVPGTLGLIVDHESWLHQAHKERTYPVLSAAAYQKGVRLSKKLNFISAHLKDLSDAFVESIKGDQSIVLVIETSNGHGLAEQRRLFVELMNRGCDVPVVICRSYSDIELDELQLYSATDIGGLLVDGLGDGIFIKARNAGSDKRINETAFTILQATRTRISKTEYISCPSCGRTLFDLQETTAMIRARTYHLKGVKIGIMGCIVNGPGEMADADYGYVGSGPGKITLYRGKEVVKRSVPSSQAVDELIELIREDGNWVEMELVENNA
ncbi:MAG: flavodoxin-dependent (E)-4-hydroxy-3-methylbut-2-enyl-diphosphate synthase, partial [Cyclobacteriaceae bacterium]